MVKNALKSLRLSFVLLLVLSLFACEVFLPQTQTNLSNQIVEDGYYTSKDDVALYLKTYHQLPENFITKDNAEILGWDNDEGNLWDVSERKSIGGDRFYNREGLLPSETNRIYFECDIDYEGGYRNAKRIVYSDDGYIYYTGNHYTSFELLYEGE